MKRVFVSMYVGKRTIAKRAVLFETLSHHFFSKDVPHGGFSSSTYSAVLLVAIFHGEDSI